MADNLCVHQFTKHIFLYEKWKLQSNELHILNFVRQVRKDTYTPSTQKTEIIQNTEWFMADVKF